MGQNPGHPFQADQNHKDIHTSLTTTITITAITSLHAGRLARRKTRQASPMKLGTLGCFPPNSECLLR